VAAANPAERAINWRRVAYFMADVGETRLGKRARHLDVATQLPPANGS
jgi:hypothetical protein